MSASISRCCRSSSTSRIDAREAAWCTVMASEHLPGDLAQLVLPEKTLDEREEDVVFLVDVVDELLDDVLGDGGEALDGRKTVATAADVAHGDVELRESAAEFLVIAPHDARRPVDVAFENRKKRGLLLPVVHAHFLLDESE